MATVVDSGRMSMYHGGYAHAIDCSPPPPIPARLHHVREPRPATALGQADLDTGSGYLAPVTARRGVDGGPPLPPRQPLRRSVSLTHRTPPEPGSDAAVSRLDDRLDHRGINMAVQGGGGGHEPTLDEVLASLRRSRMDTPHPAPLSPALSAPLLGQVSSSNVVLFVR